MTHHMRLKAIDRAERRALTMLRRGPASFTDMVRAGIMDKGTATTVRDRLVACERVEVFARRHTGKPGRPDVLYRLRE